MFGRLQTIAQTNQLEKIKTPHKSLTIKEINDFTEDVLAFFMSSQIKIPPQYFIDFQGSMRVSQY